MTELSDEEIAQRIADHRDEARAVLADLGLEEVEIPTLRPTSGHNSSLLLPCAGHNGEPFLNRPDLFASVLVELWE